MFAREAQRLGLLGVASLRIDFAGHGENPQLFQVNTYDGMTSDSRAALDWLIERSDTDDDRIGVLRFSLGGRLAATIGGTDSRVQDHAIWSGAVENGMGLLSFLSPFYPQALKEAHVIVDLGYTTVDLSLAWFETMMASRALDEVGQFGGRLLVVAGGDDRRVDPDMSRVFAGATLSTDVTLRIIPGADHLFNVLTPDQSMADAVIGLTADWYAERLGGNGSQGGMHRSGSGLTVPS
jgi:dienelactone hydrolase